MKWRPWCKNFSNLSRYFSDFSPNFYENDPCWRKFLRLFSDFFPLKKSKIYPFFLYLFSTILYLIERRKKFKEKSGKWRRRGRENLKTFWVEKSQRISPLISPAWVILVEIRRKVGEIFAPGVPTSLWSFQVREDGRGNRRVLEEG